MKLCFPMLFSTLTVNIEPRSMRCFTSPVFGCTTIFSTVLDHDVANIHVTNDVTVHRHVLADHEPTLRKSSSENTFIRVDKEIIEIKLRAVGG